MLDSWRSDEAGLSGYKEPSRVEFPDGSVAGVELCRAGEAVRCLVDGVSWCTISNDPFLELSAVDGKTTGVEAVR